MSQAPARAIPVGVLLLTGVLALLLGLATSVWVGVALIVFAFCASVTVIVWARARGDMLVTAVALLLFWMPFQFTQTRFNVSPQEVGVYLICIVCALFDRRGVWRWIGDLLTTSSYIRLALLIFVLACVQSFMRIAHPDLVASVNSFHTIVLYPILFGLLIAYTMRTRKAMGILLKAFFAGAAAFAAFALALRFWGVEYSNGAVAGRLGAESSFLSLYHPNNLALYIVLAIAFAPGIIGEMVKSRRQIALKLVGVAIALGVMLLAVWLTYSRGTLGSLALGMVVVVLIYVIAGRGRLRNVTIGVLAVIIGGAIVFSRLRGPSFLGRYAILLEPSKILTDTNVTFRLQLYKRAVEIASQNFVTGIGLQQFATTGSVPFSPHNTYLDLLVGIGVFGVLAFVIILLLGVGVAWKAAHHFIKSRKTIELLYAFGFVMALVAFITEAFLESFDANPRIAPIVFMLALCAFTLPGRGTKSGTKREKPASGPVQPDPVLAHSDGHPYSASAEEQPAATDWPAVQAAAGSSAPQAPGFGSVRRMGVMGAGGTKEGTRSRDQDSQYGGRGRPTDRDVWGGWGLESNDWSNGPYANEANEAWQQQTMVLPAWQFQAGDVDQWKVDSAQLPAIGRIRRRADASPSSQSPARASGQSAGQAGQAEQAEQQSGGTQAGEEMLRRAPTSFVWNQIYAMWFFATGFLLSIVITRGLSRDEYGIYAILTTIITTVTFLCAIGLEDAATIFLPRVQARDGSAATGVLIRRMLVTRVLIIGFVGLGLTIGMLVAAPIFVRLGVPTTFFEESRGGLVGLRTIVIGLYLVGGSISTLQIAFFSALLRSRIVLLVGGISQVASVLGVFILLRAGWGIDGVFAALAVVSWLTVLAYLVPLSGVIFARGKIRSIQRGEMRKLMVSAWLTNISNTALGKQMDIMIMTAFVVGSAAIGYYNLAYQLGSIIGVVLISGLGGVGMAAMSAALATGGARRLISMWRANIMLQVMLAVPLQALCFVFADQIVTVLYGTEYAGAAVLLRVFLVFSMVGRLTGGGASQSALYVIGKQRSVVVLRWAGLVINVILDITLIQAYGPLGAMVATGFSQVWVGFMEYFLLRMHLGTAYPVAFTTRVTSVAAFASLLLLWWAPGGLFGLVAEFSLFWALFVLGMWITNADETNDLTDMMLANPKIKSIVGRISRLIPRRNPVSVAA